MIIWWKDERSSKYRYKHSDFDLHQLLADGNVWYKYILIGTQKHEKEENNANLRIYGYCYEALVAKGKFVFIYRFFIHIYEFLDNCYKTQITSYMDKIYFHSSKNFPPWSIHLFARSLTFWRRNFLLNFSTLCI
jgi:hypothetical protein